ncbi:hypothetical protein Tco_1344590 [Tanacetum coccineum]
MLQDVQANVDNIREIVESNWQTRKLDWQNPITDDIKQLFQKLLILVAHKALKNVGIFEQALKEEMLEHLKYVKFVEKEADDLKMEIEYYSKDFVYAIHLLIDDIDEYAEMACKYLEKIEECERTVQLKNDQFAPILGYGDLVQGNVMIKRVYYVEGLNYNLFSVGQFCDADLEVAFRISTCFVRFRYL